MAAAMLNHLAGEPRQLEPIAWQQVVAHRGHVVGGHRAYRRERPVGDVRRELDALGEADCNRLAQRRVREGEQVGVFAPLAERQPGQRIEAASAAPAQRTSPRAAPGYRG